MDDDKKEGSQVRLPFFVSEIGGILAQGAGARASGGGWAAAKLGGRWGEGVGGEGPCWEHGIFNRKEASHVRAYAL